MKRIFASLVIMIFYFEVVGWGQLQKRGKAVPWMTCGQKICILPPVVGIMPGNSPKEIFIANLREFHRFFVESLTEEFLFSDKPKNLWWVVVVLRVMPGENKWFIEVNIAEEKEGVRPISVVRIALLEREAFDVKSEAKRAAQKTRKLIFSAKKLQRAGFLNLCLKRFDYHQALFDLDYNF
jgi:hypothetical protein